MALLTLVAIRLALAAAGLGAALAVGASHRSTVLAFLLGLAGGAIFVLTDPRRKLVAGRTEPRSASWWRQALRGTYPSTLGLCVLAAVALAFNAVLAAALAGIVAGLGAAAAIALAGRLAS
jgi:hypothetical protein